MRLLPSQRSRVPVLFPYTHSWVVLIYLQLQPGRTCCSPLASEGTTCLCSCTDQHINKNKKNL